VELTDSFSLTRATGMKAWIDDRILELDSDVEGRYETGK
jgi:lipopolysaccharide export system protein LptC